MFPKTSKGYRGLAMEGPIATWYTRNTEKLMEEYKAAARLVAERLSAGNSVLELAPGPGYLAIALAQLGNYRITGLDISKTFVEIAQAKARDAGVHVDFRQGNASQMPFVDNSFDCIACRAAFKNFAEPVAALNEMHRVLKPGGRAVIFDLRGDASEAELNKHVDHMGIGRLSTLMTKWAFKFMLKPRAYTPASFEKLVSQSRFRRCEIHLDSIGMAIWLNKCLASDSPLPPL